MPLPAFRPDDRYQRIVHSDRSRYCRRALRFMGAGMPALLRVPARSVHRIPAFHRSPWATKADRAIGRYVLLGLSFIGLIASSAVAIDTTWIGAEGAKWSLDTNWTNRAPDSGVDAFLDNGNTATVDQIASLGHLFLGYSAGSMGKLRIEAGTMTVLSTTVGQSGSADLTITGGAQLAAAPATANNNFIGSSIGSVGTVSVEGTNSAWNTVGRLYVGARGSGLLTITDGGRVSHKIVLIGFDLSSTGKVTVDGPNSALINSGVLIAGDLGTGTLTITNGGRVSSSSGIVAAGTTSTGTVTVDGTNSIWNLSSTLNVGGSGTGNLAISNGGAVSSNGAFLGAGGSESSGTLTLNGVNSVWNDSQSIAVGNTSPGTVTVSNGGRVSCANMTTVANSSLSPNSTGTLTVSGKGSTWTSNTLYLGQGSMPGGKATVNIADDGQMNIAGKFKFWRDDNLVTVNLGSLVAGALEGTTGTLRISDAPGSTALVLGSSANGNFSGTISDNIAAGSLKKTGTGVQTLTGVNTYSGGTTIANGVLSVAADSNIGTGRITLAGGTLRTTGDTAFVSPKSINLTADSTIDAGNTAGTTLSGGIDGDYSLTKVGSGVLALSGSNAYLGLTAVNAGSLFVYGTHSDGGTYTVACDATLGGTGTIGSSVSLNMGARLAPGPAIGAIGSLAIGSLAMSSDSILNFDLDQPGIVGREVNDLITVQGSVLLDGIIDLRAMEHFGPGSYTLLTYGGTASYRSLRFDSCPAFVCPSEVSQGNYARSNMVLGSGPYLYALEFAPSGKPGQENLNLIVASVPEPLTIVLLGTGALGLLLYTWRRSDRRAEQHGTGQIEQSDQD